VNALLRCRRPEDDMIRVKLQVARALGLGLGSDWG